MSHKISFGTDGWRGIIAKDFTFDNVRLVARAVAAYINEEAIGERGIVIGRDNRFLAEEFAEAVAEEFNKQGIPVYMCCGATPTPVTAYAIKLHQAAGAVMLTASHNPPPYNGFKFIPETAGPALPHITKKIEENIAKLQAGEPCEGYSLIPAEGRYGALVAEEKPTTGCTMHSPFEEYIEHIATIIDLDTIRQAGLKIVIDPMFGAGIGYLEHILGNAGAELEVFHNHRDPLFGGTLPEPTGKSLEELKQRVTAGKAHLGLALDGDADRFGIIDANGEYITPNQFLPLLYYHLLTVKGWRGPVARTVATTHLLDRMAAKYNQPIYESPVGFKYIGQNLLEKDCILGGEESGGLSIKGHIPEKDGILAGLLAAEMVAQHGKSLTAILESIYQEFGRLFSERLDIHTTPQQKTAILEQLKDFSPTELGGQPVIDKITLDGVKLIVADGAWVLIRASGTEPLFRIYTEANSLEQKVRLQQDVKNKLDLN
ncbi:Phosphoglucomutase [Desulforamulus reducens MI-1]|uniref:Phosphoglucomutase n=1 Tax=Desulforamulus reducens (strain ATCC BAA-1160 / DSM 100696 / MI-1) TaxID=349161 RepID=A4J949_DESRM|nr:phosphoglucomutase/phosphomannomutase family protein [Desulforamulus reducens]ABO51602.1 Phosphoglucomutase [Desulforamulus reducens MI-1]